MEDLIRITKKVEELEREQLEVRRKLKWFRDRKRKWENIVSMRHQREIEEKKNEKPAVAFNSNPFATFANIKPVPIPSTFIWPVPATKLSFEIFQAAFAQIATKIEEDNQPEAKRQRTN